MGLHLIFPGLMLPTLPQTLLYLIWFHPSIHPSLHPPTHSYLYIHLSRVFLPSNKHSALCQELVVQG